MRIKETGIYQIFKTCFPPIDMRKWRSQMEGSYKKYLKSGSTSEESLNKLERQYMLILMDIAVKHPDMFRSKPIHQKVVEWMHREDSVVEALPKKTVEEENKE